MAVAMAPEIRLLSEDQHLMLSNKKPQHVTNDPTPLRFQCEWDNGGEDTKNGSDRIIVVVNAGAIDAASCPEETYEEHMQLSQRGLANDDECRSPEGMTNHETICEPDETTKILKWFSSTFSQVQGTDGRITLNDFKHTARSCDVSVMN